MPEEPKDAAAGTQHDAATDAQPAGGGTPQDGGSGAEQYFLEVDERHRYKTSDDVKKAVQEASTRIGELTPLAEALEDYGINDAKELKYYLDRLIELEEKAGSTAAPQPAAQPAAGKTPDSTAAPGLSKEDEEAIKYIQKIAPHLGIPSRDQIEEMKKAVESLKSEREQGEQREIQTLIEAGQVELRTRLEANGMLTKGVDEKQSSRIQTNVENFIRAWMESRSYDRNGEVIPGSPIDRFLRGGRVQQSAIEEGLREWEETVSFVSSQKSKSGAAAYQGDKQKAMQKSAPPLTKPNGSLAAAGTSKKPTHDEALAQEQEDAWNTFQSHLANQ